jgi:hypothetical protein
MSRFQPKRVPWTLLSNNSRSFLVPLVALVVITQGRSQSVSDDPTDGPISQIVIEDVSLDVYANRRLTFRVRAGQGRMDEDSQVIEMDDPYLEVLDEEARIKQSVSSRRGRVWPVKVTVAEGDQETKEVSKYDWALEGEVTFESAEGYQLDTPQLIFSSRDQQMASSQGVLYRIPTGRGNILSGRAQRFEAQVDTDSGSLVNWTLIGGVELSIEKDQTSIPSEEAP